MACGAAGELPVVRSRGALGSADLSALAEVGLTLLGERPTADGDRTRTLDLAASDALPLMSSSAFTLAECALGLAGLHQLAGAAVSSAALAWTALRGNPESVAEPLAAVTPFPGAVATARRMRELLTPQGYAPIHIQDFFGLRTWPQAHGPLVDALAHLDAVLAASVNAASENPHFHRPGPDAPANAMHHGGFHTTYLALALDGLLLALVGSAQATMSRISHLLTDASVGLPRFLADGGAGSGLLIGEYVAGSALAQLRTLAGAPCSIQTMNVSAAIEDDASFSSVAAAKLGPAADAWLELLAVELLSAICALRIRAAHPAGELGQLFALCGEIGAGTADRDLTPELDAARSVVLALL
jgi:histidine ammonia-lyase